MIWHFWNCTIAYLLGNQTQDFHIIKHELAREAYINKLNATYK